MEPGFEWDPAKARANLKKHGVSFAEAASAFNDAFAILKFDDSHSFSEDRLILTGLSNKARLVTIVHVDRGSSTRIISARRASKPESDAYAKAR